MAKGNPVVGAGSVVINSAVMDAQPAAGVTWMLKNVYFGDGAGTVVKLTDGVNEIILETSEAGDTGFIALNMLVNNSWWLRLLNGTGSSQVYGYDGFVVDE